MMFIFNTVKSFGEFIVGVGETAKSIGELCKDWNLRCPDGSPMSPNTRSCAGRQGFIPFTEEQRRQESLFEPPKPGLQEIPSEGSLQARYPSEEEEPPPFAIRHSPFGKAFGDQGGETPKKPPSPSKSEHKTRSESPPTNAKPESPPQDEGQEQNEEETQPTTPTGWESLSPPPQENLVPEKPTDLPQGHPHEWRMEWGDEVDKDDIARLKIREEDFLPREDEPEETKRAREEYKQKTIHSESFKSWFGDYEKDPKNASKVVNTSTGDPKETYAPVKVYHGTYAVFGSFSDKDMGDHGLAAGRGFYFSENPSMGAEWGNRVIEAYLNIRKPFSFDQKMSHKEAIRYVEAARQFVGPEGEDRLTGTLDYYEKMHRLEGDSEYYFLYGYNLWKDLRRIVDVPNVNKVLGALGHDGIAHSSFDSLGGIKDPEIPHVYEQHEDWGKIWVAFNPNQIKSVNNIGSFNPTSTNIYKSIRPSPFGKTYDYSNERFHPDQDQYQSLEGIQPIPYEDNKALSPDEGSDTPKPPNQNKQETTKTPNEPPPKPENTREQVRIPMSSAYSEEEPEEPEEQDLPEEPETPQEPPKEPKEPPQQSVNLLDHITTPKTPPQVLESIHKDPMYKGALEAISENPQESGNWLMFADWVEEKGADQVAQNIRVWEDISSNAKSKVKWDLNLSSVEYGVIISNTDDSLHENNTRALFLVDLHNLVRDRYPLTAEDYGLDLNSVGLRPIDDVFSEVENGVNRLHTSIRMWSYGIIDSTDLLNAYALNALLDRKVLEMADVVHPRTYYNHGSNDYSFMRDDGYKWFGLWRNLLSFHERLLTASHIAYHYGNNSITEPGRSLSISPSVSYMLHDMDNAVKSRGSPNRNFREREGRDNVIYSEILLPEMKSAIRSLTQGIVDVSFGVGSKSLIKRKALSSLNTLTGGALRGAQLGPAHPPSSSFQEEDSDWNFDPLDKDKKSKQIPMGPKPQAPEVPESPFQDEHWHKSILQRLIKANPFTGERVDVMGRHYCYAYGRKVPCNKQGGGQKYDPNRPDPQTASLSEMANAPSPAHPRPKHTKIEPKGKGETLVYAIIFNADGQLLTREDDPWGGFIWTGKKKNIRKELEDLTGYDLRGIGVIDHPEMGQGYFVFQSRGEMKPQNVRSPL